MVPLARFKLTSYALEERCLIQLDYSGVGASREIRTLTPKASVLKTGASANSATLAIFGALAKNRT